MEDDVEIALDFPYKMTPMTKAISSEIVSFPYQTHRIREAKSRRKKLTRRMPHSSTAAIYPTVKCSYEGEHSRREHTNSPCWDKVCSKLSSLRGQGNNHCTGEPLVWIGTDDNPVHFIHSFISHAMYYKTFDGRSIISQDLNFRMWVERMRFFHELVTSITYILYCHFRWFIGSDVQFYTSVIVPEKS